MTKTILGFFLALSISATASATKNLPELLGFKKDDRLLILQSDDLGILPSIDEGALQLLKKGTVQSGALIANAPTAEAAAKTLMKKFDDLGVHLALVSEWKTIPWGPLTNSPSLRNDKTFFHTPLDVLFRARSEEVAAEIEAQVQRVISWGVKPTHIDTHMGSIFMNPSWVRSYLEVAKKYRLPPMIPRWSEEIRRQAGSLAWLMDLFVPGFIARIERLGFVPLDGLYILPHPAKNPGYENRKAEYVRILNSLPVGISEILVHPAILDENYKKTILSEQPGEMLRVDELRLFQEPDVINLIKEKNIHIVKWKQIQEVYRWDEVKEVPSTFDLLNPLN